MTRRCLPLVGLCIGLSASLSGADVDAAARSGDLRLRIVDEATENPLPCRIHLKNARGVARKAPGLPFLHDHFVCDGTLQLTLREGTYTFEIECGPEYHTRGGHFAIDRFSDQQHVVPMRRITNMAEQGWWSGDLHVRRRLADLPLLMQAEDLHVAEVVTWTYHKTDLAAGALPQPRLAQFDTNRYFRAMVGRDARAGGGLSLLHLDTIPDAYRDLADGDAEYPPAFQLVQQARGQAAVWVDADATTCWDLPVWVAHGTIDSVKLAGSRFLHNGYGERAPGHRPRDRSIYGGPDGLGRWSDHVYYQLLNCGLRLPPTAGSGSGDVNNPVGYNRMYVHCGREFSYQHWWDRLRAGHVVVTNGPLLRPSVEGQPPGYVFRGENGKTLRLQIDLQLATKDPIEYLEIVQDGQVEHVIRLDDYADRQGRLPLVEFTTSGWFLVRAVTGVDHTHRFACSGPYYVQFGDEQRISRSAAEFFCQWVLDRARKIDTTDPDHRRQVLELHRTARDYWQAMIDRANAP